MSENIKKKLPMTEAQKKARMANLERGRAKRMEQIQQKKQEQEEYDLSSNDDESNSESDDDAFIIAKKKVVKASKIDKKSKPRVIERPYDDNLKNEVNELKNIVYELATMQKKQQRRKRSPRPSGGTKIVVLPNNTTNQKPSNDSVMEHYEGR